jgi:cytoplasmic iron level regulating protein YaaA (DUF328/UPF0246 family)
MLIVLSPAKTLDMSPVLRLKKHTVPEFLPQAHKLVQRLRQFSADDLERLMEISPKLAAENATRFAAWHTPFTTDNAKPALAAFQGDVYVGLDAGRFTARDCDFAQRHLRILSGLYGVLRPLDLIQAYRLEMGTALSIGKARNLYEFWGNTITAAIERALYEQGDDVLINLASQEYFQAIHPQHLTARIITPVFQEIRDGRYRVLSFFAKKARGMMASFVIRQRLKKPEQIQTFNTAGYRFQPQRSSEHQWVFARPQP